MKIEIKGNQIKITTSDGAVFTLQYSHITEIQTALNIVKAIREHASLAELNLEV